MWTNKISVLPPHLQSAAERLVPLVQGGQGKQILAITHSQAAQTAALESFVHGVNWALRAGAGLTFAAALVAGIGLAHMKVQVGDEAPAAEGAEAAEAPPAIVEM
jgi:hypothetical protein